jgi:hypothetical protein
MVGKTNLIHLHTKTFTANTNYRSTQTGTALYEMINTDEQVQKHARFI